MRASKSSCVRGLSRVSRLTNRLRGAAAAIKTDSFSFEGPPRHDSFMRWLGDPPSAPAPPACNPHTKQQTHAGKSTNQHGYDWSMKISRSNWGGDPEADDPTNERAPTILGCEPVQPSAGEHRRSEEHTSEL